MIGMFDQAFGNLFPGFTERESNHNGYVLFLSLGEMSLEAKKELVVIALY